MSKRGLAVILSTLVISLPVSAHAGEDVLRLLIWEGHAPKHHVEKFEKQIEAKHGRRVKLKIEYSTDDDHFYGPSGTSVGDHNR